jgi:hypothetical protein
LPADSFRLTELVSVGTHIRREQQHKAQGYWDETAKKELTGLDVSIALYDF